MRRDGADSSNAEALLARFVPGPGRTGRVVLHPRLTIVPLLRDDFAGLQATFATDVDVRVATAADVVAGASVVERAAAYDEAIENLEALLTRHEASITAVTSAERRLQDARVELDRVAVQRARAHDVITAATEHLALLEGAGSPESDLRRELEAAREAAAAATVEYEVAVAAAAHPAGGPPVPADSADRSVADVAAAEQALAEARRALADLESEAPGESYALDAASKQLQTWAAQRAVEVAQYDLERLQVRAQASAPTQIAVDDGSRERVASAASMLAAARARLEAAERALSHRAESISPPDPEADADAVRAQIEAVRSSLAAAETARNAEIDEAHDALDTARREAAVAERQLAVAIERFEPGCDVRDAEGVLGRVRTRRATLDQADASGTEALLRLCAHETVPPILVLVEPFSPAPADLVDAAVAVSETKRIVLVTGDETVLDVARQLDPETGAVRTPLVTGGPPDPASAQRNGNLL